MDTSTGSKASDVERLVGELAAAKGENVQLRKQLALAANEEELFRENRRLEADGQKAVAMLENYDATVGEVLELATLEPGDEGSALYRLGKIAAICEAVPELELTPVAEKEDV